MKKILPLLFSIIILTGCATQEYMEPPGHYYDPSPIVIVEPCPYYYHPYHYPYPCHRWHPMPALIRPGPPIVIIKPVPIFPKISRVPPRPPIAPPRR